MSSVRVRRAIPTTWAGCRFRSRTEARAAVFFHSLGMRWEYEREGFEVGRTKEWYLPDFYLPDIGLWLEIKPTRADLIEADDVRKWENFAGEVSDEWDHDKAAMWIGDIPDPATVDRLGPPRAKTWYEPGIVITGNWRYAWCACPTGQHFDIQEEARGGLIECGCPRIADGRVRSGNHPAILAAYSAARSARFEHGEKPAA